MDLQAKNSNIIKENLLLKEQISEYKDLIDAISNGEVDALAITKDGHPNVFSLETNDFVYRVLVENFAESALNVTDKGLIVYSNPAFENLLGCNHNDVLGKDLVSLVDPKHKKTFETLFRNAFLGTSKGEISLNYKGKSVQVYISMSSLFPRFPGIGILITDLSEKKQQEEEISNYKSKLSDKEEELLQAEIAQMSTEKFRVMADVLPHKVWTADEEGNINYFNKKWLDYTELSFEELKGSGWKKVIHPDDWKATDAAWKKSINTGKTFESEHRLLKYDGSYRWYRSHAIGQSDIYGNVYMWVGTHTDIEDQKSFTNELEKKILERTSFIQQVLDSSVELITTYDLNLNYTSVNKTALEYMSHESANVIGKHVLEVYPELADTVHYSYLQRTLKGENVFKTNIDGIFKEGLVFESYFKPLIVDNEITGVLVMARNITEILSAADKLIESNKQLEEKNLELVLSNTGLASFSYIASHDLQEPLRKIQTFIDRILDKEQTTLSKESKDYLLRILSSANRMRSLLDALLSFYKASVTEAEVVETNLNLILDAVKKELRPILSANNVTIDAHGLPTLPAIPAHMHQVFSNLISNSVKFRKKEGLLSIKIIAELITAEEIEKQAALPKRKYWKISFSDNGIGFSQAYEDKIFQLFQKLHSQEDYSGTGIGLSICQKIVQSHYGLIKAEGNPGVGATFKVYLPFNIKSNELAA